MSVAAFIALTLTVSARADSWTPPPPRPPVDCQNSANFQKWADAMRAGQTTYEAQVKALGATVVQEANDYAIECFFAKTAEPLLAALKISAPPAHPRANRGCSYDVGPYFTSCAVGQAPSSLLPDTRIDPAEPCIVAGVYDSAEYARLRAAGKTAIKTADGPIYLVNHHLEPCWD